MNSLEHFSGSLENAASLLTNNNSDNSSPFSAYVDLTVSPHSHSVPPLHDEVLLLQSRLTGKHWSKRTATLNQSRFKLFKPNKRTQPSTCINFDLTSCEISICPGLKITLQPVKSSKTVKIRLSSPQKLIDWVLGLYASYCRSRAAKEELARIVCHKRFWKRSFITERQLLLEAETGDLILFKGKTFGAMALRLASRSDFDHVGMLLRTGNGALHFVEALGHGGVQLHPFLNFRQFGWHAQYRKVFYRKLLVDRSKSFEEKVMAQTQEWLGRPYSANLKKLARKVTTGDHTTFFCSELVAAYYKIMGVLPKDIVTSQFWPSNFGSKKKLKTQLGSLGELSVIIF